MRIIHSEAIVIAIGLSAVVAFAGGDFSIPWYTIDGGGGASTGGAFAVTGTIGQHDAGTAMSGGPYTLNGGFWAGGGSAPCLTDLNGDGDVGPPDLAALLDSWGRNPGHPADFNNDGNVGPPDLAQLLDNWGPCP